MRLLSLPEFTELFWSRVDQSGGPDACWTWTRRRDKNGYGIVSWKLKARRAHRMALQLSGVDIPNGMLVCHRCDNPPCCNPAHLFLGTAADNTRDMMSKGRNGDSRPKHPSRGDTHWTRQFPDRVLRGDRHPLRKNPQLIKRGYKNPTVSVKNSGEGNGRAKLRQSDLAEIKRLRETGMSQQAIGALFGVKQTAISRLLHGHSWKRQT